MQFWALCVTTSLLLAGSAGVAMKSGEDLTSEDIAGSTTRIMRSFHLAPTDRSIFEQATSVGETSSSEREFYVTFRPSLGGAEVWHCRDRGLFPLENVGLAIDGAGHAGLTKRFSRKEIEDGVVNPFVAFIGATQPHQEIPIFVEGFSAGAHRAVEAAAYLKQHDDTKRRNIILLRYAGAKTFDDIAVERIQGLLGRENIFHFRVTEDIISPSLDIPGVESSLGHSIEFSALESEDYTVRVNNKVYTRMDQRLKRVIGNPLGNALTKGVVWLFGGNGQMLDPDIWEAHQPLTYQQLCSRAFAEFIRKKPED